MPRRGDMSRVSLFAALNLIFSGLVLIVLIHVCGSTVLTGGLSTPVFPEWAQVLQPERDSFFYHCFVAIAIVTQAAGLFFYSIGKYKNTRTAENSFPIQQRRYSDQREEFSCQWHKRPAIKDDPQGLSVVEKNGVCWQWGDAGVLIAVVLFMMASPAWVLSRVSDNFYHIDHFVMSPAWAAVSGLTLNVDAMSQYSVVIPQVLGKILDRGHQFNYPAMMALMMGIAAVYWAGCYIFLRVWLKDAAVAVLGIILAINWQMFHAGVFPVVWQFPSATVLRQMWDLAALWLILNHLRTGRTVYVWLAALVSGIALAWMTDTGTYLWLALAAYLVIDGIYDRRPLWPWAVRTTAVLTMALISAFVILWALYPQAVFRAEFWHNTFDFIGLFVNGWGALPMTLSWKEHHYLAYAASLAMPALYVWTVLTVTTLCLLRRMPRVHILPVVIGIYGLGTYHYYVVRSAPTSFAVVCIPLVFILCFWLKEIPGYVKSKTAKIWGIVLIGLAAIILAINPLFQAYLDRRFETPWDQGRTFNQEAALIQQLTSPQDRVPLISSFETKILMDAHRKPFFYFFPMVQSDAMPMRQFRGTFLYTQERMRKTIEQLETDKPPYVFVERKLFMGEIPSVYYVRFETLTILMAYLHQRYTYLSDGGYLLALKRKGS